MQIENLATGILSSHGDPSHLAFLASAKENLSTRFRFVGITEEFSESVKIFRRQFSSRNEYVVPLERENRSRHDIRVPASVRIKIEQLNELDCALYEHARGLLGANRDRFQETAERRAPRLGE